MENIAQWKDAFNKVGWFLPPYVQMRFLSNLATEILARGGLYTQDNLESALAIFYGPGGLAAMVKNRYPIAPIIKDYRETIAEAIEAHFFGLNHVAVGGLIPVIEGAGRQLAKHRGLASGGSIRQLFVCLAEDCKNESISRGIGKSDEVASMMDSFATFTKDYMYLDSASYPLADKTNRHGITHGAYADDDYGRPLNFYKTIAAVDCLTVISSFRANISWLAPDMTPESTKLAAYYLKLLTARRMRVR